MEYSPHELLEPPVLLERDHESLVLAWKHPNQEVEFYELEMCYSDEDGVWGSIANHITHTVLRKHHLDPLKGYKFRVRFQDKEGEWSHFSKPTETLYVLPKNHLQMEPPSLLANDFSGLTIQWNELTNLPNLSGYRLRYRKELEPEWHLIDSEIPVGINHYKVHNLQHGASYYFAIHPLFGDSGGDSGNYAFSMSNASPFTTIGATPYFHELLPHELMKYDSNVGMMKMVNLDEAIAGKTIALYFSGLHLDKNYFTNQLKEVYHHLEKQGNNKFEIIFCSCDENEENFNEYFAQMPWYAIPFDSIMKRDSLMDRCVFGPHDLPKFTVFNPAGGVLEENVIKSNEPINLTTIDEWIFA